MTPKEIIRFTLPPTPANITEDRYADFLIESLAANGFVIIPKPKWVSGIVPGIIALEYEDTPENREMAREVAAKMMDEA